MIIILLLGIVICLTWGHSRSTDAKSAHRQASELKVNLDASLIELQESRTHLVELETKLTKSVNDLKDKSAQNESSQGALERVSNQFANDSLKFICTHVTAQNLESSRKKLDRVFEILRKNDVDFPESDQRQFYEKITDTFKEEVRKDEARQEQQQIKEQIREEQRAERERQQEIKHLETQQAVLQEALAGAMKQAENKHSAEIEELKKQLALAQAKTERAKSQAELTKSGHVYVISNPGSFGENVFKIGMTRRLEPSERIHELSDAAVPFPYDVHMMISCEDAPKLETTLHHELHSKRVNKVNLRKEFFRSEVGQIRLIVERHHGKVDYIAKAEAFEYRETLLIEERGFSTQYDPRAHNDQDEEKSSVA